MYNPSTIISQITHILPRFSFESLVKKYEADKYSKTFKAWNLLTVMLTAHIKGWESLRDIETSFLPYKTLTYHIGLKSMPKRSTLSEAASRIPHELFESFFHMLVTKCQDTTRGKTLNLDKEINIFDASIINLAVDEMIDWKKYRTIKGAIKLHANYNLSKGIPTFVNITNGDTSDYTGIDKDTAKYANTIVVADRGYLDVGWLADCNSHNVTFVIRSKKNLKLEVTGQHPKGGQIVSFATSVSSEKYPEGLRLVEVYDQENDRTYKLLTNDSTYTAETIGKLYKARWEIEIFFKWLKQNLKIKTFFGTSENAVKSQIWIALILYVLIRYIQSQCQFNGGFLGLFRILRESWFSNRSIIDILGDDLRSESMRIDVDVGQLSLF